MKYGISSLLGPGLAGVLLLGSGCVATEGEAAPPRLVLDISLPSGFFCTVVSDSQDRTCDSAIALNGQAVVEASVDWGGREPGSLEVSDDCGGDLAILASDPGSFQAEWTPPATPVTCVVTARATSEDGTSSELSATVMVQGNGLQGGFPRISVKLSHSNGICVLPVGQAEQTCSEPITAGDLIAAEVQVDWGDLLADQVSVSSLCGDGVPPPNGDPFTFAKLAPLIDTDCTPTFEAIASDGTSATAAMSFSVVDGQPPGEVYAYLYLEHADGECRLRPGAFSTECTPVAAGANALVFVEVAWGNYEAGSITVDDDCNGSFSVTFMSMTSQELDWDVPSKGNACTVQAEAVTADGKRHTFELNVPMD
jgi:hypothetical protein